MSLIADILGSIWELFAEAVGAKFGWKVGVAVFVAPFVLLGLVIWLAVR